MTGVADVQRKFCGEVANVEQFCLASKFLFILPLIDSSSVRPSINTPVFAVVFLIYYRKGVKLDGKSDVCKNLLFPLDCG